MPAAVTRRPLLAPFALPFSDDGSVTLKDFRATPFFAFLATTRSSGLVEPRFDSVAVAVG